MWKDCRNILVIRLDNMGDLIMTNAALQEIKEKLPMCKLTLLTSSSAAPIVPYLRTIDRTIIFDTPWMKLENSDQPARALELVNYLRKSRFDGCIIFSVYSQNILATALLAYLAEIPLRTGYVRENPYQLLTHWFPDPEPLSEINHQIERDLKLLRILGLSPDMARLPQLSKSRLHHDTERAQVYVKTLPSNFILVNMEVSEAKRQFPALKAKRLIKALLDRDEYVLFTGLQPSAYLEECVAGIQSERWINMMGKTAIDELLYIVEHAAAVITVNTGIAHISCAYDRPTVVLYANTNPQHHPWSARSKTIVFDIPENQRSKNQTIRYVDSFQINKSPMPSNKEILRELDELLLRDMETIR